jgi:hypothetical protein
MVSMLSYLYNYLITDWLSAVFSNLPYFPTSLVSQLLLINIGIRPSFGDMAMPAPTQIPFSASLLGPDLCPPTQQQNMTAARKSTGLVDYICIYIYGVYIYIYNFSSSGPPLNHTSLRVPTLVGVVVACTLTMGVP